MKFLLLDFNWFLKPDDIIAFCRIHICQFIIHLMYIVTHIIVSLVFFSLSASLSMENSLLSVHVFFLDKRLYADSIYAWIKIIQCTFTMNFKQELSYFKKVIDLTRNIMYSTYLFDPNFRFFLLKSHWFLDLLLCKTCKHHKALHVQMITVFCMHSLIEQVW